MNNGDFIIQVQEKKIYEISVYIIILGIIFLALMVYAIYQLLRLRKLNDLVKKNMLAISVVYALPERQETLFILWIVLSVVLLALNIWLFIKRIKLRRLLNAESDFLQVESHENIKMADMKYVDPNIINKKSNNRNNKKKLKAKN